MQESNEKKTYVKAHALRFVGAKFVSPVKAAAGLCFYFAISFIFITLVSWRLPDNMLSFSESNLFVVSEQYSVVRCWHLKVGQNSSGNSWDLR